METRWGFELIGQTLEGRYHVVKALSEREDGNLFLANDERVRGREVAVYAPDPSVAEDPAFGAQFAEELQRVQQLEHPRMLKILGGGFASGVPYVLLEYLPGGTLKDRLQGGILAPQQVLSWLPDIAEALDYMHSEGVLHADLRPAMIFFDALGQAYLADFTVSKAAGFAFGEGGSEMDRRYLASLVFELLFAKKPSEISDIPAFLSKSLPGFNAATQALTRALSLQKRDWYPTCRRFSEAFSGGLTPLPLSAVSSQSTAENNPSEKPSKPHSFSPDVQEDFAFTAPPSRSKALTFFVGALSLILASLGVLHFSGILQKEPAVLLPTPTPQPTLPALELKSETLILPGNLPLEMLWVAPGPFVMGCWDKDDECQVDEKPTRTIVLDGFWISKTELTQKQWMSVMKTNPSAVQGDDLPVTNVSWEDAQSFLKKAKQGLRLPREAEWEKAARQGYHGSRYGVLEQIAWFAGNSSGKVQAVGQKQPSPLGLADILGNVREWCQDGYELGAYKSPYHPSVQEVDSSVQRVIRGGAWDQDPRQLRATARMGLSSQTKSGNLGLRLARSS